MNENSQEINIQRIKSSLPSKCSISQVGNKLVEMCEDGQQCKLINNILECPGYTADSNTMYGFIEDIGMNPTLNEDRYSITNTNGETYYNFEESNNQISDTIRNSINSRTSLISQNVPNTNEQIYGQMPINSGINTNPAIVAQTSLVENEMGESTGMIDTINSYRPWIIFILVLFAIILIGLIVYGFSYYNYPTETLPIVIDSPVLLTEGSTIMNV